MPVFCKRQRMVREREKEREREERCIGYRKMKTEGWGSGAFTSLEGFLFSQGDKNKIGSPPVISEKGGVNDLPGRSGVSGMIGHRQHPAQPWGTHGPCPLWGELPFAGPTRKMGPTV
jgi:hypothetical protein